MKPILFNTKMVKAILDGRKSVTRRINKDGSEFSVPDMSFFDEERRTYAVRNYADKALLEMSSLVEVPVPICPGDILWVRETWAAFRGWCWWSVYVYKAGYDPKQLPPGCRTKWHWHPSIHMPKEAARIFLRVTDVRVERLSEITDEQALAEGVRYTDFGMYQPPWKASLDGGKTFHPANPIHYPGYHVEDVTKPEQCFPSPRGAFANLWNSTIKPADREKYGWAANPWVWVIEFERCEKPKEDEDGNS